MSTDWNKIKFRASSWGNLLTEPREKSAKDKGELSETCKKELLKIYSQEVYGRKKEILTAAMEKGRILQSEGVGLVSRLEGDLFAENHEQLENEWFSGKPDMFTGKSIRKAEKVGELKNSWELDSFLPRLAEEPDKEHAAQINVYYSLTGAQEGGLFYTLQSAPIHILNEEIEKLQYRMAKNSEKIDITAEFVQAAKELEKLLTFPDIPEEERCIKIPVPRDEVLIERMKLKVPRLREWLSEFHKKHKSLYKTETV